MIFIIRRDMRSLYLYSLFLVVNPNMSRCSNTGEHVVSELYSSIVWISFYASTIRFFPLSTNQSDCDHGYTSSLSWK